MRGPHLALAATLATAACEPPYARLVPTPETTPRDVQSACKLTAERCTQCHTIDRVVAIDRDTPDHWQSLVARMRAMPGSAITAADSVVIVQCLVARKGER